MMRPVKRYIRNHSVGTVLNVFILPVLLTVLLVFGLFSALTYQDVVSRYIASELQLTTEMYADYLNSYLSDVSRVSYALYASRAIRNVLDEGYEAVGDLGIARVMEIYANVIDPTFSAMNNPPQHITRLYLIGDYLHIDYNYLRPAELLEGQFDVAAMAANGYSNTYWAVGETISADFLSSAKGQRVLFHLRMIYADNNQPLAVLVTEISIDHLERMISRITVGQGNAYQWLMPDGTLIFQSQDADMDGSDMTLATAPVSTNGSTLEIAYSNALLRQQLARQWFVFLLLSAVMILISFLLIRSISHYVLKRLSNVRRKYEQFDSELLPAPLEGKDEAAFLDQAITALYVENKRNMETYYALQMTYRAMEYQMLMSKINPHFLYNTLSAIKWSLKADEKEEASRAVDMMVAFYRGILGQGSDMVILQTELEVLADYVQLQAYTYSRQIELKISLGPGTATRYILRFLLQPIVENAINHTQQTQSSLITIEVEERDAMLCIRVHNNGDPIAHEALAQLNSYNDLPLETLPGHAPERRDKVGYGVFNVIARIRLLFGNRYGLWYSAPDEGGTQALFSLPLLAQEINMSGQTLPLFEEREL